MNKDLKKKKIKIKLKKYKVGQEVLVKPNKNSNNLILGKIKDIKKNKYIINLLDKDVIEKYGNHEISYIENDIHEYKKDKNNILIKENETNNGSIIRPLYWVLPNKKEFIPWLNKTFDKYKLTGKKQNKPKDGLFKPFLYQKFVRDYMQLNSPYRGLLLFHGLGSGKTCTAIQISENLKTNKNIIILLPASLKKNFKEQGLEFCGSPEYKYNKSYDNNYTFISYNSSNVKKQIESIGSFDNHVIIIEEAHNLVSMMVSGLSNISKNGKYIYDSLMQAKNCKIIALTGTPLINNIFELAILFNILRGYIEITIFSYKTKSEYLDDEKLKQVLEEIELVDYIDINLKNKTIEVHLKISSYDVEYQDVINNIIKLSDKHSDLQLYHLKPRDNHFSPPYHYTLFPDDNKNGNYEQFSNIFLNELDKDTYEIKNSDIFKKRILGLISYYDGAKDDFPTIRKNEIVKVKMSDEQFKSYTILREIEKISEKRQAKESKTKKSKDKKGAFRSYSRHISNFNFPENINRPYRSAKIEKIILKGISKKKGINNINDINEILEKETNNKITKTYKKKIDKVMDDFSNNPELLKPNNLKILSPKMNKMLEILKSSKGLSFVYSSFKILEGLDIFAKVLEANGFQEYDINDKYKNLEVPKYAIYSGSEDLETRQQLLNVFTDSDNKNGEYLSILMATSAGAEGLDLKNIRRVLIMEPHWNEVLIQQIIGRAVRRNSHKDLPINERNVDVYRFISSFSSTQKIDSPDKSGLSTDEHILELAKKKKKLTDSALEIIKECAIDCLLNKADINENYNCFSFPKNAKGLSYLPNINNDIVYSNTAVETKIIKTHYSPAYLIKINKKYLVITNNKGKLYSIIDLLKKEPLKYTKKDIIAQVYINKNNKKIYNKNKNKLLGSYNNKGFLVK